MRSTGQPTPRRAVAVATTPTVNSLLASYQLLVNKFQGPQRETLVQNLMQAHINQLSLELARVFAGECPPGTHYEPGLGCVPD